MFRTIRHLLEMIRFSHTLFALPFALIAALMAWRMNAIDLARVAGADPYAARGGMIPLGDNVFVHDTYVEVGTVRWTFDGFAAFDWRWQEIVGILLCMVTARSAAMAFNRIADRRIDAGNPRTAKRHLPAGVLSLQTVVLFALFNSAAFIVSTLIFWPNWLPIALSVPVLLFLLAYSYTKRFTALAHVWLGAALMLAPISAWIAIRGLVLLEYPPDILPAVVLGGAVLLWVTGFDIIYACQDFEFDQQSKLNSIPVRLGIAGALRLAALLHFGMIVLLALLPLAAPQLALGWIYFTGVAAVAALLVWEHWLVRPDDLTRVNVAFFNINIVVSIGLLLVVMLDLLVN
jgi:4-hydroxybenzoate polyprenyltransferase